MAGVGLSAVRRRFEGVRSAASMVGALSVILALEAISRRGAALRWRARRNDAAAHVKLHGAARQSRREETRASSN